MLTAEMSLRTHIHTSMSTKSCTSVVASNHVWERESSDERLGRSEQAGRERKTENLIRKKRGEKRKEAKRETDKERKGQRTKRKRKKERKKDTKSKRKNDKQEKGEVKVASILGPFPIRRSERLS